MTNVFFFLSFYVVPLLPQKLTVSPIVCRQKNRGVTSLENIPAQEKKTQRFQYQVFPNEMAQPDKCTEGTKEIEDITFVHQNEHLEIKVLFNIKNIISEFKNQRSIEDKVKNIYQKYRKKTESRNIK